MVQYVQSFCERWRQVGAVRGRRHRPWQTSTKHSVAKHGPDYEITMISRMSCCHGDSTKEAWLTHPGSARPVVACEKAQKTTTTCFQSTVMRWARKGGDNGHGDRLHCKGCALAGGMSYKRRKLDVVCHLPCRSVPLRAVPSTCTVSAPMVAPARCASGACTLPSDPIPAPDHQI